jgi:hypothetical protein
MEGMVVQEGGDGCEKKYSESQTQNSKQDLLFLLITSDSWDLTKKLALPGFTIFYDNLLLYFKFHPI